MKLPWPALLAFVLHGDAVRAGEGTVEAGDRVRLRSPSLGEDSQTGKVIGTQPDALVVRLDEKSRVVTVPLRSLERLEVARGKRSMPGEGALMGFVPGALFGAVVVGQLASGYCNFGVQPGPDGAPVAVPGSAGCDPVGDSLKAGVVLGGITAALGALVGLTLETERWQRVREVPVQVRLEPVRDDGLQVSLAVRF